MEDIEVRLLPIRGCFECRFFENGLDFFKSKCYIDIRDFKRGMYSSTKRGKVIQGNGSFGDNCPLKIKSVKYIKNNT